MLLIPLQPCVSQEFDSSPRKLAKTLSAATVRIETPTDVSSGVIISSNGLILSVAHGLAATDRTVTVFLHDGRSLKATVRFRDANADVALVQIINVPGLQFPKPIPLQSGRPALLDRDRRTAVFGCGYPARESNGQSPVFRIGRIEAQNRNAIRTSCVLTAGDSGGPLANSSGQLIGLHRRIGLQRDMNVHVPTRVIRDALSEYTDLAEFDGDMTLTVDVSMQPSDRVLSELRARTVRFYSANDDQPLPFVNGTLITPRLAATKLSELSTHRPKLTCGRSPESAVSFSKVASDRQLDVAIVRLHQPLDADVSPLVLPLGAPNLTNLFTGQIIFAGPDAAIGVVARTNHCETGIEPRLGLSLLEKEGRITVEKVSRIGAASDAELLPGDRLIQLADNNVTDLDDVAGVLSQLQPGDHVVFDVERNDEISRSSGQLTFPADRLLQRTEFLDGRAGELSRRRTGFTDVIQHDVDLVPSQMGGPLLDSQGLCVGINIARCGRESVLAIPFTRLAHLQKALLD
jgi:serine protease Do